MNEFTAITLFCLVDDFLKKQPQKRLRDPSQQVMSDSEVIFTGIFAAYWVSGNLRKALFDVAKKRFCLRVLSESQFLRRLKKIPELIWKEILKQFAKLAKGYNSSEFVIDSFPYAVCHNMRILQSRIVQGAEYRGYTASKKEYFYGIKLHMIISTNGIPIYFEYQPGSIHDLTAFKEMNMEAIEGGVLYADSAYTDYSLEEQLSEQGLILMVQRASNSHRPWPEKVSRLISKKRKTIENSFSRIMRLFPRRIHAVRLSGVILKMTLFFIAFAGIAACST